MLTLPDCVLACPATLALIVRGLAGVLPRGCYDDAWDALEIEAPRSYQPQSEVESWMRQHWPDLFSCDQSLSAGSEISPDYPVSLARAWMPTFLNEFVAGGGNATKAAAKAEIHERTPYKARESDKTFAEAWEWAERKVADAIRAEIYRRAVEGWEEPQFGMLAGKGAGEGLIGTVRKFDSSLLIKMATARVPEYRSLVKEGAAQVSATASATASSASEVKVVTKEEVEARQARTRRKFQHQLDRLGVGAAGNN